MAEPPPFVAYRLSGGGGRIRTFEAFRNGFTVRPIWPLWYPSRKHGAGDRNRTRDLLITSQLLYLLSYSGMQSLKTGCE
jgi:hypothetical protein